MKRSISGPLVVILIGVLFLFNNFYPDVFTWRSMNLYWPFILIGLGVVRLLEVLAQFGRGNAFPSSRFSFGGIVLLAVACLAFWGISEGRSWHGVPFVHGRAGWMFADSFDFDLKQSLSVSAADSRLLIEGIHGNVTISGDDSSEVALGGHKSIHAFSHSTADEANRKTKLELVRDGNDLVVRAAGSPGRDDLSISYDVDIRIPRRLALSIQGSAENVSVESLDGNVDVSGSGGNVVLTSIGGNVRLESTRRRDLIRAVGVKGTLDLRGTGNDVQLEDIAGQVNIQGSYYGTLDFRNLAKPLHFESEQTDLRVEKLPGSISMDLGDFRAEDVGGPLRLRCHSRDVHISNFTSELEVNVERGDIEIDAQHTPLAKMDVHLSAGNVTLTVPEKAAFALRATTAQGDVENEFGQGLETTSEGRTASLKSEAVNGPAITMTTDRGNITVRKS